MEDFLTTITPGIAFAIMAFASKLAIDRWLMGRTKEVIARFANGRVETFTVNASASDVEVADAVRDGIEFEFDVGVALGQMSQSMPGILVQEGGAVDFLVRSPEKTIAIECKADLDNISAASIERYLSGIKGQASRLLLVSTSPPSASAASTLKRFVESGQLSYIPISRSVDIVEALTNAISIELGSVGAINRSKS